MRAARSTLIVLLTMSSILSGFLSMGLAVLVVPYVNSMVNGDILGIGIRAGNLLLSLAITAIIATTLVAFRQTPINMYEIDSE